MIRVFLPLGFVLIFFGWLLYRMLVKKDLKHHLNEVFGGVFFMVVWAMIYWGLFSQVILS